MDFPTNFCVCAAHYFLCAAAEGTLLLTPGSYEELVAASIVPVAVTIVIVYYRLWQSWWFFWTEKIGLLLRPPQLKNPICAPDPGRGYKWLQPQSCSLITVLLSNARNPRIQQSQLEHCQMHWVKRHWLNGKKLANWKAWSCFLGSNKSMDALCSSDPGWICLESEDTGQFRI